MQLAGGGCGWNLWLWLVGVVVRRYIHFLILLSRIPTPLVSVLFAAVYHRVGRSRDEWRTS